jgi:very-short-patch-repair endonuclease
VVGMLSAPDTIRNLGGLARGMHLQRIGFDRRSLSRLVASGEIERVRPGVFAVPPIPSDVRLATLHGGALTCASVLRSLTIWTLPTDDGPHVWLGPGRHAHPHDGCTCTPHYFKGRPPLGAVDVVTALLHFRRCAGDEAFFAALESAREKRLVNRQSLARIRAALPSHARWLIDLSRPDSGSGLESILRLRMHILGIRLQCQVTIPGVGRVDFVVAGRLIIEADGRENHAGPDRRHKDLVRDAAASALGYETLHFDYAQIVHDWPTVQAAILAALRRCAL